MQRSDADKEQWGAGEDDRRGSVWSGVLATAGLTLTAAGTALALGPDHVPELAAVAGRLAGAGVQAGSVLVGGLFLSGLGVVLGRVSAMGRQLRSAEESVEIIQTLSLGMRHLVERMTRLSAELVELKEADRALLHLVRERSGAEAASQQVDATFRLAASVDRLERRLEERLGSHEERVGTRVEQLGLAVGGTQDQLRGLLATTCRLGEQLDRLEELVARASEPEEEPLEVSVELDPGYDDGDDLDEVERPHPSSFDWDAVRIPEQHRDQGLGFLDEVDEPGSLARPATGGRPAELDLSPLEEEAEELAADGLELLDALERELGPLQGPPAPADRLSLDDLPSALPSSTPSPITPEALDEAWEAFERRRDEDG